MLSNEDFRFLFNLTFHELLAEYGRQPVHNFYLLNKVFTINYSKWDMGGGGGIPSGLKMCFLKPLKNLHLQNS